MTWTRSQKVKIPQPSYSILLKNPKKTTTGCACWSVSVSIKKKWSKGLLTRSDLKWTCRLLGNQMNPRHFWKSNGSWSKIVYITDIWYIFQKRVKTRYRWYTLFVPVCRAIASSLKSWCGFIDIMMTVYTRFYSTIIEKFHLKRYTVMRLFLSGMGTPYTREWCKYAYCFEQQH